MKQYLKRNLITLGIIWPVSMIWSIVIAHSFGDGFDFTRYLDTPILWFWGGLLIIFSVGFAIFVMVDTKADMKAKYKV